MGTRGLYCVIHKAKTVVAQYGQWDANPEGNGVTLFNFLKSVNLDWFKEKLEQVKFVNKTKQKEIDKWLKSIGSIDGWLTTEQSKLYQNKYPYITRDLGGKIMELILCAPADEIIWVQDSIEFAADSLFCEWAYVIDLDKGNFEVYEGYNHKTLSKPQRFKYMEEVGKDYTPVKCIKKFKISKLSKLTEEEFLALVNAKATKDEE